MRLTSAATTLNLTTQSMADVTLMPLTVAMPTSWSLATTSVTHLTTIIVSTLPASLSQSQKPVLSSAAPQDTDSDGDVYAQRYAPSAESLGPPGVGRMGNSDSSTPTFVDYGGPAGAREPYPSWIVERQIPLSKEEIEDIFLDLTQKFGFQRDSMRNMVSSVPSNSDSKVD